MFAHNPHHGSGQAVLPHPVAEICAVRRDSVARHLRRKRPNRYRYQDRSRAPTTRGSRATGIPFTDITAGMKVIGRVLRMPAPVGQVHALKAAFFYNGYWDSDRGRFERRHEWDHDRDRDHDRYRKHEEHRDVQ